MIEAVYVWELQLLHAFQEFAENYDRVWVVRCWMGSGCVHTHVTETDTLWRSGMDAASVLPALLRALAATIHAVPARRLYQ